MLDGGCFDKAIRAHRLIDAAIYQHIMKHAFTEEGLGEMRKLMEKKCTWGEKPQITCQLDTCNRHYEYARRSGQVGFDCQHIQPLVYRSVATNLPVALDEEILTDIVINKWFSKDTE
ncbi:hypothetical protein D9C73_003444 [Collichthys lucidus]|uniref:Uncharacterized protein n=1 Tax=Collichthys lucidus TaxID=240159 RepID=A0A4U5U6A6_COLLU|nr:hypothetical protein D9C73_003444 [Collichthys lucidus]